MNKKVELDVKVRSSGNIATVLVESIIVEKSFQAREETNSEVVREYSEAIRAAGQWPFPPIVLVSNYLVDGFHRILALRLVLADPELSHELRKNLESVPCIRVPVDLAHDDVREIALSHAVAANSKHGLRRTNADKRRSIRLALAQWPEESNRSIAKRVGVSHTLVAKYTQGASSNEQNDECQVAILPDHKDPKRKAAAEDPQPAGNEQEIRGAGRRKLWRHSQDGLGVALAKFRAITTAYQIDHNEFVQFRRHIDAADDLLGRLRTCHEPDLSHVIGPGNEKGGRE